VSIRHLSSIHNFFDDSTEQVCISYTPSLLLAFLWCGRFEIIRFSANQGEENLRLQTAFTIQQGHLAGENFLDLHSFP